MEPLRSLGFKVNPDGSVPPIYLSPLTAAMVAEMEASPRFHKVMKQEPAPEQMLTLFPERYRRGGQRAEYGGDERPVDSPQRHGAEDGPHGMGYIRTHNPRV